MPAEITMPQLSDTMTEGTLVKWLKKEGDKVKSGDKIAEVETDKAVMEQEAFDSGTMAAILIREGEKVAIGAVMAVLATGKENPADVKKQYASGGAAKPAQNAAKPNSSTLETASSGEMREEDHIGHGAKRQSASGATAVAAPPQMPKTGNGNQRVRISPLAKRIAAGKNVDTRLLTGTGPGGRIVKQDVLAQMDAAPVATAAIASRPGSGEKQVIPLNKMRSAIARSLQASKQNIPHFYETIEADVEELVATRVRLNELLEPQKIRLSVGDFVSKAVAMALIAHPALNATFNGTEITRYGDVHLGMASRSCATFI
jgi:pyruvate dehydrogenase E2 component (dihydrolipoamide acetyltransferase)